MQSELGGDSIASGDLRLEAYGLTDHSMAKSSKSGMNFCVACLLIPVFILAYPFYLLGQQATKCCHRPTHKSPAEKGTTLPAVAKPEEHATTDTPAVLQPPSTPAPQATKSLPSLSNMTFATAMEPLKTVLGQSFNQPPDQNDQEMIAEQAMKLVRKKIKDSYSEWLRAKLLIVGRENVGKVCCFTIIYFDIQI